MLPATKNNRRHAKLSLIRFALREHFQLGLKLDVLKGKTMHHAPKKDGYLTFISDANEQFDPACL
jgi:hypothetical protein